MPRSPRANPKPRGTPVKGTTGNIRHDLFAAEYLVDFDAGAAYARCGYEVKDDDNAQSAGRRLLRNVRVQEVIEAWKLERIKKVGSDADKTILRLQLVYLRAMETDDLATAISALDKLCRHYGCYEKHNTQKRYSRDDLERLRTELEAAGMDFRAVNFPTPPPSTN